MTDEIREKEQRVLEAAYRWRYVIVTPGVDVRSPEEELVEAVDELDKAKAYNASHKTEGR